MTEEELVLCAQREAGSVLEQCGGPTPDAIMALLLAVRYIAELNGLSGQEAAPKVAASFSLVCTIPIKRLEVQ